MPLAELLPINAGTDQWSVWGTTARLVVRDPAALLDARAAVDSVLRGVDAAASRFRPDSEICRLAAADGRPVEVSPVLAALVGAANEAARRTDGDVDPTLGRALCDLGYDRDLAGLTDGAPGRASVWASIRVTTRPQVRLSGRTLTVPPGVLLDLGATAKACAADSAAHRAAERTGSGVLVALGGDIATADPGGGPGWDVLVQDGVDQPACTVGLAAGHALATSSTLSRRWRQGGQWRHHVLDPRTCLPVRAVWRTVSVAAPTCVAANTLTTAALVRGEGALPWLRRLGVAARLVAADGNTTHLGGWPPDDGPHPSARAPSSTRAGTSPGAPAWSTSSC